MLMIALRIMFILVTCGIAALLLVLADCLVNVTVWGKSMKKLIQDLIDTVIISGTVGGFGFDGYYDTDTPETPIDVKITLDSDEIGERNLRAHCESNGNLYSDELGGDICEFLAKHGTYEKETVARLEKWIEE